MKPYEFSIDHERCICVSLRFFSHSLFQDQIRVSKKTVDPEKPQLGLIDRWYHTACFVSRREELAFKPDYTGAQLKGFKALRAEDQGELKKRLPAVKSEGWEEERILLYCIASWYKTVHLRKYC